MKIYIAARYGRRDEANSVAFHLRENGHEITSTWINQVEDEMGYTESEGTTMGMAIKDLDEIRDADAIVALSEVDTNPWGRGGRHVEFGYAIGLEKRIYVVGPMENLFHYLPQVVVTDTIFDLIAFFEESGL